MQKNSISSIGVGAFFFALCLWLLVIQPSGISSTLISNWVVDVLCLFIAGISLAILNSNGKCDLLSAPFFVGTIYIIMFFITPLYDIYIGETTIFEATDIFDYGIIGSLVALAGFIIFCFVYNKKCEVIANPRILTLREDVRAYIEKIAISFWLIEFIVGIVCVVVTQGFSVSYILTFGLYGDANAYETSATFLGFICQFTRGVVPLSLIIFALSKKKKLIYGIILLTAMFEMINGFRYMIVIMICGFFFFNYISKSKKVDPVRLIVLSLVLCFVVGIVGYSRNSVRTGAGFDGGGFGFQDIMDALLGNFRIYKSYYAVIKAVPSMTPYLYFDQMLIYTMIMAIPRMIWPNKPLNPGTAAQYYGMGQTAVDSGYAYPNLGEYYYSFGTFGVLFFMGWFGYWLAKTTNKYRTHALNIFDIVKYCITVPLTLQLLIRGYMPSNFYLIIALYFPCWYLSRKISKMQNPYIV